MHRTTYNHPNVRAWLARHYRPPVSAVIAVAVVRSRGSSRPVVNTAKGAFNLAELLLAVGDLDHARPLISEALEHARELRSPALLGGGLSLQAVLALQHHDLRTARRHSTESIQILQSTRNARDTQFAVSVAAAVAAADGRPRLAAQLWGALSRAAGEIGDPHTVAQLSREWLPHARDMVNDAVWDAAWALGTTLDLDQALALIPDPDGAVEVPG